MEAWQLALLAYHGVGFLVNLLTGAPASPPATSSYRVCHQARPGEGALYCPSDFTAFSMPEPDAHWMVRP